jgi:hypothetical protein
MKRVVVLLFIAVVTAGLAAQTIKVAPTTAVVDYLVSRGADSAAIDIARANSPSEALFLAPGAPSKEALAKILAIVDKPALATDDPEYVALGYDPHDELNGVVLAALTKFLPKEPTDYTQYSMQIGDVVWSVSHSVPGSPE